MNVRIWLGALILCVHTTTGNNEFRLGLEEIPANMLKQLQENKVGIVTNQTGKDRAGTRNIDILLSKAVVLKRIFAPEHGVNGDASAGHKVDDRIDSKTQIPIVSLYGNGSGKKITREMFDGVDLLLFDMQDVGMRHYTYISTLFHVIEAAQKYGKKVMVLDRPNPLGAVMEGPLVEKAHTSFASIAPIPLRHGMTVGELAWYFNQHLLKRPAQLSVIKMQDYKRSQGLPTLLPAQLSPNITTKASCYGYSFLGLLGEVRPFDVGIGTDKPFQYIALPEKISFAQEKWQQLKELLEKRGVQSSLQTYYSARKKMNCRGLQVKVADVNAYTAFSVLLATLRFFKRAGVPLAFSPFFDKAVGTSKVRSYVSGNVPRASLISTVNAGLYEFSRKARGSFLYKPHPKVMIMQ